MRTRFTVAAVGLVLGTVVLVSWEARPQETPPAEDAGAPAEAADGGATDDGGAAAEDGGAAESPGTCHDNQKNGDESDVDCGGPRCPACADGKACVAATDCRSRNCENNVCAAAKKAPTCWDNEKNGDESDVDCGGPKCPGCAAGKQCTKNEDCRSRRCSGGTCAE